MRKHKIFAREEKNCANFIAITMLSMRFLIRFIDSYFGNKYRLSKRAFSCGEPQYIELHESI